MILVFISMDVPRKNKRTFCSPKIKTESNSQTNQNQERKFKSKPQVLFENRNDYRENQYSTLNSTRNHYSEATNCVDGNKTINRKPVNYKIQKFSKIPHNQSDRISRERQQDHSYFTAANAQIFQTKAAYFPGNNFGEIKQVLNSNEGNKLFSDKIDNSSCNFVKRINFEKKDKVFGKHLILPKKKSKKVKMSPKFLNPIEELNESDKSNESLRKLSEDAKKFETSTSITMTYTATLKTDNVDNTSVYATPKGSYDKIDKEKCSIRTESLYSMSFTRFGKKESVSYIFQGDGSLKNSGIEAKNIEVVNEVDKVTLSKVFQIRDMFENMSKNKKNILESSMKHTNANNDQKICFKHAISCEECRKILKNLMQTNDSPNLAIESPDSILPKNSERSIVDSLIEEILDLTSGRKKVNLTIETSKIGTTSLPKNRIRLRKKRKSLSSFMPYKNFLMLAFGISIVLYCFYYRMDEKKR
ncbi:hypothetical protein HHI36_018926 [Cryptolaemus montrouzieri]|uniref:Uncharacterized protein n=1 Tax=Cryptolaemus montrouzieri TaxID=559131 RepID=A0ABD2P232_9CUCU